MRDDFSWEDVADDVVIPEQAAIAVFTNPAGGIVLRQAGQYGIEEDHWIYFHSRYALALAKAILSKAGLDDLAIVHVSQLRIQNGGGELLQPFPNRATVDAVDRAGDAHELGDDRDEGPEAKKDRTAAQRQRRRREKQRQRDGVTEAVTEAVTERDTDRDTVTTAPAFPDELDFQGGQKALAD
jgi:hypothetical protein